jgi:sugar O-acyltransferase (sialic acid O-acetyltransferase NeuD family)
MMKTICIFGSGGFAKEVYALALDCGYHISAFIDVKEGDNVLGKPVKTIDYYDPEKHVGVLGIGSPKIREKIVKENPHVEWISLVHPNAVISHLNIKIGKGAVICANSIITTDITIGDFTQLNLATTIGHDCVIGDYFTTAPGVHISGNCNIGDRVYFGTGSSIKEKLNVISDSVIGAGACVLKNIIESGIYVGIPAIKK